MADQQQEQPQSPIKLNPAEAKIGLNMDNTARSIKPGSLSYALNAQTENFDGREVTYQNEQANIFCCSFPTDYKVIGVHEIIEKGISLIFLCNPVIGGSEIGTVKNCVYTTLVNAPCLNFNINSPILQLVHKITNCSTEVYWTDGKPGGRRYIDIDNLPYRKIAGTDACSIVTTTEIDCNRLSIQPNFLIPQIQLQEVQSDGTTQAGTYQFAIQYSNALGDGYTSYYSVTNPLPLFDQNKLTPDFNYEVGKAILLSISNIDTTGYYDYFNLAVIKTINSVPAAELVGTYFIDRPTKSILYSGASKTSIKVNIEDIFAKFPIYDSSDGLYQLQEILGWKGLTSQEQVNYQKIANRIKLLWQSYKFPKDAYKDPLVAAKFRSTMRDEVYPYEICFLHANGHQTEGFHIPARIAKPLDILPVFNDDVYQDPTDCSPGTFSKPRWQVYSTASSLGKETTTDSACYEGVYESGEFSYWESSDPYPCNKDVWGELAGKPIRHHKFPDCSISPIHDSDGNIYPLGVKVDVAQIKLLIAHSTLSQKQKDSIVGFKLLRGNRASNKSIIAKGLIHNVIKYSHDSSTFFLPNYGFNDVSQDTLADNVIIDQDSKQRFSFHSPDTSFFQPSLGNILKLETIEQGQCSTHAVQVKNHSKIKLYTDGLYTSALGLALALTTLSITLGVGSTQAFNGEVFITTYQTMVDIFERIVPRVNYAYQINGVGEYTQSLPTSEGNKQRTIEIGTYITPGILGVGDDLQVNNFQRESAVYVKTNVSLPYTHEVGGKKDTSKTLPTDTEIISSPISSYYASIKRNFSNQYGQIYSYETIDTGCQVIFNTHIGKYITAFGGDIFINRFAYKSKIPLFTENGVNKGDDTDIFYNQLSNFGDIKYWYSAETKASATGLSIIAGVLFGTRQHKLYKDSSDFFYRTGKMFLFAYGIPFFYCESEVNTDLRQGFNSLEGDFYPRVGHGIPDEWLQEKNVSIQLDNTYTYNRSFSKQSKENFFAHLPENWTPDSCKQSFPFRTIFSDQQGDLVDYKKNNWLIYRPASRFDFPQNNGRLISIDPMENKQALVRFENKSQIYNALLTLPTSAGQAALGSSLFRSDVPPFDFEDADTGYAGSQHKFTLNTEKGRVSVDARRGQVFIYPRVANSYSRPQVVDISGALSKFFTENLDFQILKSFPDANTDNHFNGCGLHGVYDAKYNRLLITKLDYAPLDKNIVHNSGVYTLGGRVVNLNDPTYFCNKSFTVSFDFDNGAWISFHSYLPNFYIGEANFFYSGKQGIGLWSHNTSHTRYNNFYGEIAPYILEYLQAYQNQDEILQNIKDYTQVLQYINNTDFIEIDNVYFNKAILYNSQNSSGVLVLKPKPRNSLKSAVNNIVYNAGSKEIYFTKSDSFYNYNTFWGMIKDKRQPTWKASCQSLSIIKELNQDNHDYSKRSFKKEPLRAKELRIRHILDNTSDYKLISQFLLAPSQTSYK